MISKETLNAVCTFLMKYINLGNNQTERHVRQWTVCPHCAVQTLPQRHMSTEGHTLTHEYLTILRPYIQTFLFNITFFSFRIEHVSRFIVFGSRYILIFHVERELWLCSFEPVLKLSGLRQISISIFSVMCSRNKPLLQSEYNVTMGRVRTSIVATEKQ